MLVEYRNELRKEHSAKTVSTSEARRSRYVLQAQAAFISKPYSPLYRKCH